MRRDSLAIHAVSSVWPTLPSASSSFHIFANCSSLRSSRLRSSRRLAFHSGSVARPRRPRTSAVVRLRTVDSILFASCTTGK